MTELLTAAQMRAVEQAAIVSGKVTGLELMERAGRGVVEAIFAEWPEFAETSHHAVVLCGPGNNGGDGFVVARLLKKRGWKVETCFYGAPDKLPPDAKASYERWRGLGGIVPMTPGDKAPDDFVAKACPDLWIDGFFGTGLTRPLPPEIVAVFQAIADTRRWAKNRLVAIDAPSGLCCDSGRMLSRYPPCADLTVSFHRAKLGLYLADGPEWSGRLAVKDIGLAEDPGDDQVQANRQVRAADAATARNLCAKQIGEHKYSYGHALILAGPPGHGGAARLAARAAMRVGAGLVTLACPPEAIAENAARLDAVMLRPLANAAALAEMLKDPRITALCLGPGLGLDRAPSLVAAALVSPCPAILDADALSAFAPDPEALFALARAHRATILTPHAGEFARLFPDLAEKLTVPAAKGPAYSKVDATREAAARSGCTILFKGPDTVIAGPDGQCVLNAAQYDRTAPWLATAGSGDVLAGFITGLLARSHAPLLAAEAAAWLHTEAARTFGPGLIAEDLPDMLPQVFRSLGL